MQTLQDVLTFTFVVSSMFAVGLALTVSEIVRPLRNVRGVVLALVANFVIVPLAAYLLGSALEDPDHRIGIVLLGSAAGAPFALKLAQVAMGDLVLTVCAMVLLIVGTVVYLPLVLPVFLPGIAVPAGAIAKNLGLQMLLPLVLGLIAHARYEAGSLEVLPDVQKVSNLSLVLLLALLLTTNFGEIVGMLGTGAIGATFGLVALALFAGSLLGGRDEARRATLSLTTAHRNVAAAFVVANGTFAERPGVFVYLAGASVVMLASNFAFAGELRRRRLAREPGATAESGFVPPPRARR